MIKGYNSRRWKRYKHVCALFSSKRMKISWVDDAYQTTLAPLEDLVKGDAKVQGCSRWKIIPPSLIMILVKGQFGIPAFASPVTSLSRLMTMPIKNPAGTCVLSSECRCFFSRSLLKQLLLLESTEIWRIHDDVAHNLHNEEKQSRKRLALKWDTSQLIRNSLDFVYIME